MTQAHDNIVTGDESWLTFELQRSTQCSASPEAVPERMRQPISTKKFVFPEISGVDGFHVVDLTISQHNFDSRSFINHVLLPLIEKAFPKGRNPHASRHRLHVDNCRVHFSKITEQSIAQNHIFRVPQPCYSPNLALSDF
jgi:hypothetical protein